MNIDIIHVEDEDDWQHIVRHWAEKVTEFHNYVSVDNIEAAIKIIRNRPTLIIVDLRLDIIEPDFTALYWLVEQAPQSTKDAIEIFILSGHINEALKYLLIEKGIKSNNIFSKGSIDLESQILDELKEAVKRLTNEQKTQSSTSSQSKYRIFQTTQHQYYATSRDGEIMYNENRVDVVIITALLKEQEAVLRYLDTPEKIATKNRIYYKGIVPFEDGTGFYTVVVSSLTSMGNVEAAIATTQAISVWNPSHIILTGITGGIKKETSRFLGDVVIGEQIIFYEGGRASGGQIERRYKVLRPAHQLYEAARNLPSEKWVLSASIPRPDDTSDRIIPKAHFGVVASGEKVVADEQVVAELQSSWSQLVGIEMEGYGTALAAYQAETAPGLLMVKGICDWADSSKNDDWQEYAADIAASFVLSLLKTAPFPSKPSTISLDELASKHLSPELQEAIEQIEVVTATQTKSQAIRKDTVTYSDRSKIGLCSRLGNGWNDLADYYDIPEQSRNRFRNGFKCQDLWVWLKERNKLDTIKEALIFIQREDMVNVLIPIEDIDASS